MFNPSWCRSAIILFILFIPALLSQVAAAAEDEHTTLTAQIGRHHHHRIEIAENPTVGKARIGLTTLQPLYKSRDYLPLWISESGPSKESALLVEALRKAKKKGLSPFDYHLPEIIARLSATSPYRLAELDLLLTDAFLAYGDDLGRGQTDPRHADPDWFVFPDPVDHRTLLAKALSGDSFETLLKSLTPTDPMYGRLEEALARYRKILEHGGWPHIETTQTLRPGMILPVISLLRERLRISGDFFGKVEQKTRFGIYLEIAVRNFQQRHGLKVDGEVGPATLKALNVPVEERIQQILVNMERWRWMPHTLAERYLLVNMAAFELTAVEKNEPVLSMRVIVGKAFRATPTFQGEMTYMVLNPYWNIPTKLAVEDILPRVRKSPGYLTRQGIRVYKGWQENATELDPKKVDWSKLGEDNFPYRLRQDPGPKNALGRIKFMFPNRFAVYLHDTPHRHLFDRSVRTFSSGCIRVEEPLALASYVMNKDAEWTSDNFLETLDQKKRQIVSLPGKIPIYLVYWTAWAEKDGTVHFRDDVYERDKALARILEQERLAVRR